MKTSKFGFEVGETIEHDAYGKGVVCGWDYSDLICHFPARKGWETLYPDHDDVYLTKPSYLYARPESLTSLDKDTKLPLLERLAPKNWQVGDLVKALDNRPEKGIVADQVYMIQTTSVHGKSIEIGNKWHPVGSFILYREHDWEPEVGKLPSEVQKGSRFQFVNKRREDKWDNVYTLVRPPLTWATGLGREFEEAWVDEDGGLWTFFDTDRIKVVE